ncbi:efflux RND transporter periplasmic adaptor subunit [Acidiferrobacter sp.]|uniref:efflux RND transporter periplasmic adaptor subunit n=1 Tax=Acidiferrobacter sp. TaxID=1872107 RepID=UPI0026209357|nr:efflux RND transporter periplasmic adaptor subunit [Acidiferrobacter sp.]
MANKWKGLLVAGAGIAAAVGAVWYVTVSSPSAPPKATLAPRSVAKAKRRILYWANPMNPGIHSDHPMKDNMGMAYTPVYAPRTPVKAGPVKRRILYWANPMNPGIHSDHPMKDNMGMAYTPVYAPVAHAAAHPGLAIDPRLRQSLGVRLVSVRLRPMGRPIHTVGTVVVDENRVYAINPRFSGWVERLNARAVGDPVRSGEVLAWVYAPALYAAEREYFIARGVRGIAGNARLGLAARERLRLLGLTRADIRALDRRGRPLRYVPVTAPVSGVVQRLGVHQGGHVSPRHDFMRITNLDRVWVNVAIYASQLPWMRIGDPVRLTLPAYPGRVWTGRVTFLYPTLDPKTRTVTARLSVPAQGGLLRPGMYAEATVLTHLRQALAVPASAVLRTRRGDFVMIGSGQGHFLPVQVTLGPSSRGWTVIRRGLSAGEKVVDAAQFLLYSESQFQAVQARMLPAQTAGGPGRHGLASAKGGVRHD